jgi:quinol monooxygenase YgiN
VTNEAILFRAVWTIKPGKANEARQAAKDFVAAVQASQPGTRWVGTHVTPDERNLIVHEVHQDAAAVQVHVTGPNVSKFMGQFSQLMDGPVFEVYGNLPSNLAAMLQAFKPKTAATVATFVR